ncbi:MAG: hypothetical protein JST93_32910 [Acidobacteria bacterium]|nr:hypothetical protein [Acidobacteriota bacterium]
MNRHPYLRAYMAGILLPTLMLLVILTALVVAHAFYRLPAAIERAVVFPMAVVPNLWGLWNVLYQAKPRLPFGVHGALLPILLVPCGYALASYFQLAFIPFSLAAMFTPVGMAAYYLVWKHLVSYLNGILGLRC